MQIKELNTNAILSWFSMVRKLTIHIMPIGVKVDEQLINYLFVVQIICLIIVKNKVSTPGQRAVQNMIQILHTFFRGYHDLTTYM